MHAVSLDKQRGRCADISKMFCIPCSPNQLLIYVICLLYSMTSRALIGYGQIWQKDIKVKEMKYT